MKTYLVTYDLNKEGASYTKANELVIKAIKAAGSCIHCLTTTYVVRSNYTTATQLSDFIRKNMDSNDHLLVTQLCNDRNGWLPQVKWDFINASPACRTCN